MHSKPWPAHFKPWLMNELKAQGLGSQIAESHLSAQLELGRLPEHEREQQQRAVHHGLSKIRESCPLEHPYQADLSLLLHNSYGKHPVPPEKMAEAPQNSKAHDNSQTHPPQRMNQATKHHTRPKQQQQYPSYGLTTPELKDGDSGLNGLSRQASKATAFEQQKRTVECPSCTAIYTSDNGLKKHLETHCYSPTVWVCDHCGYCSRTERSAKRHLNVRHSKCLTYRQVDPSYTRQAFGCPHDGSLFFSLLEFRKHLRSKKCPGKDAASEGQSSLEMRALLKQQAFKDIVERLISWNLGNNVAIDSLSWPESPWVKEQINRLEFGTPRLEHGEYPCGIYHEGMDPSVLVEAIFSILRRASLTETQASMAIFPSPMSAWSSGPHVPYSRPRSAIEHGSMTQHHLNQPHTFSGHNSSTTTTTYDNSAYSVPATPFPQLDQLQPGQVPVHQAMPGNEGLNVDLGDANFDPAAFGEFLNDGAMRKQCTSAT